MARTITRNVQANITRTPTHNCSPSLPIDTILWKLWGVENCLLSVNQGHSLRCLSTILFKNGQFYIKGRKKVQQERTVYQIELVFHATTCKQICLIRTPCFYYILSNFSMMRKQDNGEEILKFPRDTQRSSLLSLMSPAPGGFPCILQKCPWHLLFPLAHTSFKITTSNYRDVNKFYAQRGDETWSLTWWKLGTPRNEEQEILKAPKAPKRWVSPGLEADIWFQIWC